MSKRLIYRSRGALTRRRRVAAVAGALLGLGAAGCSFPISIPLGSLTGGADEPIVTGSTSVDVVDNGVSERVGGDAWAALRAALVTAAESVEDGRTYAWRSETSRVAGTVTAVDAFFDDVGVVCRRLAITATAYQRTDSFAANACRNDSGWTVTPSAGEA